MSLDTIVEYLRSGPTVPPGTVRTSKVAYTILNSLGSIVLVHENRRVVRKANVINHTDIRINTPIDYLDRFRGDPMVSFLIGTDTTVWLMYCHRPVEKIKSHCRGMAMLGSVSLVFTDHRTETEDAQMEHARRCECGHLCHSRPPTYILSAGDRLVLATGTYYIRACSESHCVYLTKREYLNSVEYHPANADNADKLLQFVKALPDTAEPFVA